MTLSRTPLARSLSDAVPRSFWLDRDDAPEHRGALPGAARCDLAVIGGGFCGLWTALLAKERDPGMDVVLVEGERVGWAASGRNGGFCSASLTHGERNGRERWPGEADLLDALGRDNLDAIERTVDHHHIDCDFWRSGELTVATDRYQLEDLAAGGGDLLDRDAVRAELDSPTYVGGVWDRHATAIVDPARLAWGLAAAAEGLGVRIYESTAVDAIRRDGPAILLSTPRGPLRAGKVALATNAFQPLLRRLRWHTVPVYDHVLMTEPLNTAQMGSIGWRHRQGVGDSANRFHYYRLTEDRRILWGGYDAIYHFGRHVRDSYDQRPATSNRLAGHFFNTFPQLEGLRFTHRWGGAIDTCTRFCAFYGQAMKGQVAYALGYTGLGVGATRFGATVMLDLLAGADTERTRLEMVRRRPIPFPPEPFAFAGIEATRWSLAQADRHQGRRNAWLRLLDRVGVGFDS